MNIDKIPIVYLSGYPELIDIWVPLLNFNKFRLCCPICLYVEYEASLIKIWTSNDITDCWIPILPPLYCQGKKLKYILKDRYSRVITKAFLRT